MKINVEVEICTDGGRCGKDPWCQFLVSEYIYSCYLFDKALELSKWDEEAHSRHVIRCSQCFALEIGE